MLKATSIANLAFEIDPPAGSNTATTELPASDIPVASLMLTADSTVDLAAIPLSNLPAPAAALLTLPSLIPGRPDLAFDVNFSPGNPPMVTLPKAARGRSGTFNLIPLSPADQMSPPSAIDLTIPTSDTSFNLSLPPTSYVINGVLVDPFDNGKGGFYARAFQRPDPAQPSVLVSTRSLTPDGTGGTTAGSFTILLPDSFGSHPITAAPIVVQLTPAGAADPWFTFDPFTPASTNTNLDKVKLPSDLVPSAYQVTVHGGDQKAPAPVAGAAVHAFTTLTGGDARGTTRFQRDASTDASGTANMTLIPGATGAPRTYSLSIIPAAASPWAATCVDGVPVSWNGSTSSNAPPVLVRDVVVGLRPVFSGTVVSSTGAPVGNVVVTATLTSANGNPCPGPGTSTTTTDSNGTFSLPLDPGHYQLDYDPPAGSSAPRLTEYDMDVSGGVTRAIPLPTAALVEGDVVDASGAKLPEATIRLFEARCANVTGCMMAPTLRGTTQTDTHGHFSVVVAAPTQ